MKRDEADKAQDWASLDGGQAFALIERHAGNHDDVHEMMEAWRRAHIAAWRDACASICDEMADGMEREAQRAIENGEHDEVSAIRSTAWKLSVAANRIRCRST